MLFRSHPDTTITNLVPMVGLILDHDTTLTPEGDKPCCTAAAAELDCWSIPVYANDSFYGASGRGQRCLDFTRSTPYCFPTSSGVREQMNILTAFIDASFVYGSDEERAFQLRSFVDGRLRTKADNPRLLPTVVEVEAAIGEHIEFMGLFLSGDERVNEMPALTTMHTRKLQLIGPIYCGLKFKCGAIFQSCFANTTESLPKSAPDVQPGLTRTCFKKPGGS